MAKGEEKTGGEKPFPIRYEVVMIEPWTFLNERGNPVAGFRVTFTYEGGFTDWVDIPEKTYNAVSVKQAIEARITKHIEVLTL
jgi:hypothetical protein